MREQITVDNTIHPMPAEPIPHRWRSLKATASARRRSAGALIRRVVVVEIFGPMSNIYS